MEFWNAAGGRLRASLKGWGANLGRTGRERRAAILEESQGLMQWLMLGPFRSRNGLIAMIWRVRSKLNFTRRKNTGVDEVV